MPLIILLFGLLVGIPIAGIIDDMLFIDPIEEAYCTKYTNSVTEYKTCKDSNLVEFIKKEGGNE